MSEQAQAQPQLHPMAQSVLSWLHEALTIEEAQARVTLIINLTTGVQEDILRIRHPEEVEDLGNE